jgi:hypothetical protein
MMKEEGRQRIVLAVRTTSTYTAIESPLLKEGRVSDASDP